MKTNTIDSEAVKQKVLDKGVKQSKIAELLDVKPAQICYALNGTRTSIAYQRLLDRINSLITKY